MTINFSNKENRRSIWDTAIGLQAVDGLKPSKHLKTLAEYNISGKKTYDDINRELIKEYGSDNSRQKEADIVALRIAELLETADFIMSSDLLLSIHCRKIQEQQHPQERTGLIGRFGKICRSFDHKNTNKTDI